MRDRAKCYSYTDHCESLEDCCLRLSSSLCEETLNGNQIVWVFFSSMIMDYIKCSKISAKNEIWKRQSSRLGGGGWISEHF